MTQTKSESDRREYFRIKNSIIINHQLVDSIDAEPDPAQQLNPNSARILLLQELSQIEYDNQAYISVVADKQIQLGHYLVNLNKKISLLTRFVIQSLSADSQDLTEVDISGGGLRFCTQKDRQVEQILRLEIVLVPECVAVVTHGRVVDSKPTDSGIGYDIALVFIDLKEADREAIIKHIFSLQSQQLREVKQS